MTVNGEVILDGDIREACQGHNVSEDGSKKNPYTVDHRNHPGLFNKKGHIGLLGHGAGIQFRNIRIKFLGDRTALDPKLQKLMNELEGDSASKTGMTLNIAVNYGGRPEIVRAAQQLAARVAAGELKPEEITEEMMSDAMYTTGQKDPDFILRPSGEKRLSNFMLWQAAYSELVEMDVLWPDFTRDDLDAAITEFNKRSRRFGGI